MREVRDVLGREQVDEEVLWDAVRWRVMEVMESVGEGDDEECGLPYIVIEKVNEMVEGVLMGMSNVVPLLQEMMYSRVSKAKISRKIDPLSRTERRRKGNWKTSVC